MNLSVQNWTCAILVFATITGSSVASAASPAATVEAAPSQTMQGIGASGAWWVNDLVKFPAATQLEVAGLLFSPVGGIGLSVYRWNIGGGGGGVLPIGSDRAPETFLQSNGTYDYSKDPGGTLFLRLAGLFGVPRIIGFVNAAPSAFTSNAKQCGDSLTPARESSFGGYLATVIGHARRAWGVPVSLVSPINEPDNNRSDCTQEGMEVTPPQRATVVTALHAALAYAGLPVGIIADESSQVGPQLIPELPQWLSDPAANADVVAVAHHTYDFPSDATLRQAAQLARSFGRTLWATEICCQVPGGPNGLQFGAGYDPTITGALSMVRIIDQDLMQANDAAFHWWTAVSNAVGCDPSKAAGCASQPNGRGYNDGLIYYDPNYASDGDTQIYPSKRLWALGNYSRFIPIGAVRHVVNGAPAGVEAMAFRRGPLWSLIVANYNMEAVAFPVDFPGTPSLRSLGDWLTDASHNLSLTGVTPTTGSKASVLVPAQSVTSFVFAG